MVRGGALERGVTVGEHAAVGGDLPVAVTLGVGDDLDDRGGEGRARPSMPRSVADPWVDTAPVAVASQYPVPSAVEAIEMTGPNSWPSGV